MRRPVTWTEHHDGFRGTWDTERAVSIWLGPWSLRLSLGMGRIRERPGAPDWANPRADPDYMCPNCVTPWKCNGPHEVVWMASADYNVLANATKTDR